jgi:hypothetical protein
VSPYLSHAKKEVAKLIAIKHMNPRIAKVLKIYFPALESCNFIRIRKICFGLNIHKIIGKKIDLIKEIRFSIVLFLINYYL